jgi:hypothetical protein
MLALIALLFASAAADCYMHNPRGSNNRLNGNNANRDNNNVSALFVSWCWR